MALARPVLAASQQLARLVVLTIAPAEPRGAHGRAQLEESGLQAARDVERPVTARFRVAGIVRRAREQHLVARNDTNLSDGEFVQQLFRLPAVGGIVAFGEPVP